VGSAKAVAHKRTGPPSRRRSISKRRKIEVDTEDAVEDLPELDFTKRGKSSSSDPDNDDQDVTHEGMVMDHDSASEANEVGYGSANSVQSFMDRFVTHDEVVVGVEAEGPNTVTGPEELTLGNYMDRITTKKRQAPKSNDGGSIKSSSIDSRQAASTDATSAMEDDTDQVLPLRIRKGTSSPRAKDRPRRSRQRVSYVELFPDASSDAEPEIALDDESDLYQSDSSARDSLVDEEFTDVEKSSTVELSDSDESTADVAETVAPKKARNSKNKKTGEQKGNLTWNKWNLPPLNNIEEIFGDMAAKAAQMGINSELEKLRGRAINVATMCSGTESPLIALEMISKGKHRLQNFFRDHGLTYITCSARRSRRACFRSCSPLQCRDRSNEAGIHRAELCSS
jgi:hypothetical protein